MKLKAVILLGILTALLPQAAEAFASPCAQLPWSCPLTDPIQNVPTRVATLLILLTSGASVLFIVVGGVQMIFNFGDDSKVQKGRNSVIYSLVGFAIMLSAHSIANFAYEIGVDAVQQDFNPAIGLMAAIVDRTVDLFNIVFIIILLYAGYRMIVSRGAQEEFAEARKTLIWAAAGAITINVANALVRAAFDIFI